VIDPRLFDLMVDGTMVKTYAIADARIAATKLVQKGVKRVLLRNVETGALFKWWPELGGAPADGHRMLDRAFMQKMLHN
jgi:hypothetical protein